MSSDHEIKNAGLAENALQGLAIPVNFIPFVGGGIGGIMAAASAKMMEKRIKDHFGKLALLIEQKFQDEEYKEQIIGAVLSASMNVGYENDRSKRQYFANILQHYLERYREALPMDGLQYLELFNSITRALSPISFQHLVVLNDFLEENDIEDVIAIDEDKGKVVKWWQPYDNKRDQIKDKRYLPRAIQELTSQGLIVQLARSGMVNRATLRYYVSDLGKEYLEWIAKTEIKGLLAS